MRELLLVLSIVLSVNLNAQITDWVKSFGGVNSDKGISIGTDSLGFVYISGFYNSEATFDAITFSNGSPGTNKENFIAKLDSNGNVLWAIPGGNQSGGCCDDRALGMHVTPGGDIFITGTYWSSYKLGVTGAPGTITATGGNSHDTSVMGKVDKDGNPQWVISFGGDNSSGGCPYPIYDADDHAYDVKVDKDGFIYVTGFFSGFDADFDGFTITNPDWDLDCQPMGYIGKLDPSGNWLWVDKFDGVKDQRGSRDNRLAIDQFSNIYVSGGFQGTGNYGPFSITSNGEWDAFIFKMDKDGNWLWVEGFGSNKTDRANSIAIDVCDDIYITGEYRNPMVFPGANASNGTDTLSHKQKRDVFVAKMNNQGQWKWAKRARTSGTDKPYQMSVDANKQVFIGGTAKGEMTFTSGLVAPPQILGDTTMSAWVAQIDGTSNNGDWVWAKMAGSDTDDDDRTNDICADGFGNVYAIGFFEDLADFDGTILDATGRKKDIFVWKMSMTAMPPFSYNNSYNTIYSDSMVFNPADTGIFTIQGLDINGCDTTFVDSVIHKRLAATIVYTINNTSSTSSITVDGTVINTFPTTLNYYIDDNVLLTATIDPSYGFSNWSSNSVNLLPNTNSQNVSFGVTTSDTVWLNIYLKPTIVYSVDPIGTTTSINVNGMNINTFPTAISYYKNETVNIDPVLDPLYRFDEWETDSVIVSPNANTPVASFVSDYNDNVVLKISLIPPLNAFISSVNNTICDNDSIPAEVLVSFVSGTLPYTFVYEIDGINQPQISTFDNPYVIKTKQSGIYTLQSFSDALNVGTIDGSAVITLLESPIADFNAFPDTLTILNTTVSLTDKSTTDENLISWQWNFGDNTALDNSQNPYHTYSTTTGLYDVSLIVTDDIGCSDTISKIITITDDYWIWVPNSFTPDLDGKNDKFCIAYNGIREATFTFNVFDRFSNLVYSTSNIQDLDCENGWDGKHQSTGNELPMGVYIYKMYYQDYEGWKHQEIKELILVR